MTQETNDEEFENKALQLQIELLHKSNDLTDNAVGRLDDIISKLRNWSIVIWTGSIALAIDSNIHELILFTVFIPLLFWIANAFYSEHLLACTYRQKKVAELFNDTEKVARIFKTKEFGDFNVFDPLSKMDQEDPVSQKARDYRQEVNFMEVLFLKDSKILYPALIITSFVVWAILSD